MDARNPAPENPGAPPAATHRTFESLVAEGAAVPTDGWDFSWFEGRATEQRPSWGYALSAGERLARATAALDIQTGGGEVLDFALSRIPTGPHPAGPHPAGPHPAGPHVVGPHATGPQPAGPQPAGPQPADSHPTGPHPVAPPPTGPPPALVAATEGWPPNVARATALLAPRGVVVVAAGEDDPLPFADGAFDLVLSRHPVRPHWEEIARVLRPGGTYFAQHVGPSSAYELVEHFLGPQPEASRGARDPGHERAGAEAAGLEVVGLRAERLRMEFHDIAAVVHFLRKVVWMVPGFTVAAYEPRLRALHERIETDGPFVAHSTRHLFDIRKPERRDGDAGRR